MNKKQQLKSIIDALNDLMGKIDSVDEPKQQPKYPKGIISFEHGVGGTSSLSGTPTDEYYQDWCHYFLGCTPKYKIHSVKNSKGEMFTVGDEVEYIQKNDYYEKFNVGQFKIDNGKFIMAATESNPRTAWNVEFLTKVEPKKPLFKTEDGFDVLEGDDYFAVRISDFNISEYNATYAKYIIDGDYYIRFKHKSNAEKYVAENQKSISYKNLIDFSLEQGHVDIDGDVTIKMKDLLQNFKPKQ